MECQMSSSMLPCSITSLARSGTSDTADTRRVFQGDPPPLPPEGQRGPGPLGRVPTSRNCRVRELQRGQGPSNHSHSHPALLAASSKAGLSARHTWFSDVLEAGLGCLPTSRPDKNLLF
jgi:hypothetical protein